MSALTKLLTGVPGLDILTNGGIPQGRATLIAGKSGTGKTVMSRMRMMPENGTVSRNWPIFRS